MGEQVTDRIQTALAERRMSAYQLLTVGICVVINFLDGFDVLVMAFAAAPIAQEWQIPNRAVGVLLSAGLVGMALGSLFLAPLADRLGRRAATLMGLTLITAGMLLSAFTATVSQLAMMRVLTGLGIGTLLASMTVLVAEYSSLRRRSFAISLLQAGYPIGAVLGGMVAVYLIAEHGWRSVFIAGGLCSAVMIPLVLWWLPESIDFLADRQPRHSLARANRILGRIGLAPLQRLPPRAVRDAQAPVAARKLLSGALLRPTMSIWTSFFMVMFSFYFVLSWTPKLLVEAGLSTGQGISGGVILNLGGIVGSLLLGYLAGSVKLVKLNLFYLSATAVVMVVFGLVSVNLACALITAVFVGFFLFGSMIGLYAVTPGCYPSDLRGTGMGLAIGVGRIGAILAPLTAGFLVDFGFGNPALFTLFAIPLLFAMVAQKQLAEAG
jgi:benzoate transport